MEDREYTLVDAINHAWEWKIFLISIFALAIAAGASLFYLNPQTEAVSTRIAFYPDIPGISQAALSVELSQYINGAVPGASHSGSEYTIVVPPDRSREISQLMATTVDKYEADLRERLSAVRDNAEEEYKKNPLNEAVYSSLDKFRMLPSNVDLISHKESIKPIKSRLSVFLFVSAILGLFVGVTISVIIAAFKSWNDRRHGQEPAA
ncbi:MAG: hypothetical protein ACTHOP_01530 [Mesorhizobium sp.]